MPQLDNKLFLRPPRMLSLAWDVAVAGAAVEAVVAVPHSAVSWGAVTVEVVGSARTVCAVGFDTVGSTRAVVVVAGVDRKNSIAVAVVAAVVPVFASAVVHVAVSVSLLGHVPVVVGAPAPAAVAAAGLVSTGVLTFATEHVPDNSHSGRAARSFG